jgi:hypothetical protein
MLPQLARPHGSLLPLSEAIARGTSNEARRNGGLRCVMWSCERASTGGRPDGGEVTRPPWWRRLVGVFTVSAT